LELRGATLVWGHHWRDDHLIGDFRCGTFGTEVFSDGFGLFGIGRPIV
jgi:hypothetical protein